MKRIKTTVNLIVIFLIFLILVVGCDGSENSTETLEKEVLKQELNLVGKHTEIVTHQFFEAGLSCHGKVCEVAGDNDNKISYCGIPLWLLVGLVDDDVRHGKEAFNDELADKGYCVTVISDDGYSVEYKSKEIARVDSIILVNREEEDKQTGYMLIVCSESKEQLMKNVKEIRLDF